jgi:hypothetical protein
LVNGDDILFRTNDAFYALWLEKITIAGFELSIGKNYVHKSIFTINSQCFRARKETKQGEYDLYHFEEITYLNCGLLIGQSKSGEPRPNKAGLVNASPIWDVYNKVMKGAYNKVRTHNRFLYYNKRALSKASNGSVFNYFLPPCLGGLGFHLYPDVKVKVGPLQMRFANMRHQQMLDVSNVNPDDIDFSTVHLTDKTSIRQNVEPFYGDQSFISLPKFAVPPEGFVRPKANILPFTAPVMIDSEDSLESPVLQYTKPSLARLNKLLKTDEAYWGLKPIFNIKQAMKGLYDLELWVSETHDLESFVANLVTNIITDVVYDIDNDAAVLPNSEHKLPLKELKQAKLQKSKLFKKFSQLAPPTKVSEAKSV